MDISLLYNSCNNTNVKMRDYHNKYEKEDEGVKLEDTRKRRVGTRVQRTLWRLIDGSASFDRNVIYLVVYMTWDESHESVERDVCLRKVVSERFE